jgi:hypothetical protein
MKRVIKITASDHSMKVDARLDINIEPGHLTNDEADTKKEKITDKIHEALKDFFYVSDIKILNRKE